MRARSAAPKKLDLLQSDEAINAQLEYIKNKQEKAEQQKLAQLYNLTAKIHAKGERIRLERSERKDSSKPLIMADK